MSKTFKRNLSVIAAIVFVAVFAITFAIASAPNTAFAMDIYANVEGVDDQLTLNVEPQDSIATVKEKIETETGISADRLTISFNSTELSNDASTLADYNIEQWTELDVAVAPVAAMPNIEFTVEVTGETTRYVDNDNHGGDVVVTYTITHNDGVNNMVLIPEFDATVFAIKSISVNEAMGAATITSKDDPDYDGPTKIAVDKAGAKYTDTDVVFLTVTFETKFATAGTYQFGLDLSLADDDYKSVAYYILGDTELGEQSEVEITVARPNSLTLIAIQNATIEIGSNNQYDDDGYGIVWDYFFVYSKTAVGVEKVTTLTPVAEADGFYVEYKYTGDAAEEDIVIKWYYADYEYDNDLDKYVVVPGDELGYAPVGAGNYVIGISAPATDAYYAAQAYAYVHINTRNLYVTIDSKSSAYGEALQPLTYTVTTQPYAGDAIESISLSCDVTSTSAPGSYIITGNAQYTGSYSIVFSEAYYTLTKKSITLTALDQSAVYTGSAFTPAQDQYTLTSGGDPITIPGAQISIITLDTRVNAGVYQNELSPSIGVSSDYYNVTTVNGTLTITTAGIATQVINGFFTGETFPYDKQEHNLLTVSGDLPTGYAYQVTSDNRYQTNAGSYIISITVTADSNHHLEGEQSEMVTSVTGTISPVAVTIEADDQSSSYGSTPVSTSSFSYSVISGTVYSGDNLHVTYGGTGASVTASTAVGEYPITMSASNGNYVITTNPGTYTVTKGQATAYYAEILDTKYNRTNSAEIIERIANHNAPDSQYDESYTRAKVGNQDILSTATYAVYDSDNQLVPADQVMECATYKFVMTVPGTANYDGVVLQNYFKIYKIHVHAPVVTYDGTQVTVTPYTYPTQDDSNNYGKMTDADNWPLFDESLVVITINGVVCSTYVPTSAAPDGLTYSISAGDNYEPYVGTTVAVFSVSFDEGIHAANPSGEVSNMPETQYVFAGQSATAPATNPSIVGCNFEEWQVGGVAYAFTEEVSANTTVVAIWSAVQYTVTFKYFDDADTLNTNVFEVLVNHNDNITLPTMSPAHPTESGKQYVFNNTWSDGNATYGVVEGKLAANNEPIIVTSNGLVFVAQYDVTYGVYTITYYFSENESTTNYTQYGDVQSVTYGDPIQYVVFDGKDYAWFKTDYWYLNVERTQGVPSTMPAEDISVYGSYKFDIGTGDVNANGVINADDITLYRQWIVGGYIMNVIAAGSEWDTVTDPNFDADDNYFLARVADNNDDAAKDIRDVSIIRMAIVGNYDWDIVVGDTVSGAAIQRAKTSYTIAALQNGLNSGRARLHADIESDTADIVVNSTGSVYLDLGGYTLTVKSLTISVSGKDATITITNGTISAEDGITIVAPNGNVVIENVTAYVDGTQINLQAANNSLHFAGTVAFYDGNITDANPEPAVINVENGTHVVIEKAADVVVDKVVVTENFVESSTATITINNNSTVVTVVTVEGKATNEINSIASMVAAFANGGEYVLTADVVYNGSPTVTANTVLDLNGHLLRSANNVAIFVGNGARLTINGDATGRVIAQEAAVTVLDGSELIVNGGTFTAQDNFVFGTNGSTGRGGNKITVNGGVINGNIQSAGYVACGIYVANSDVVVVNGGTFNVVNGCGILARSGNTTVGANVVFNVEGSGNLGKVGDSQVTVPTGKALVLDLAAGYPGGTPSITNNSAAEVTTVNGVSTFAQLSAATGYVVLTANINAGNSDIVYSNDVNISLNGKTITFGKWGFEVRNGATLTINGNGVVNATEACLYAQYAGHLVVNGGTFISTNNFVIGTNGNAGRGGNTIVVNGGTFNGDMSEAARTNNNCIACGIYVANDDTLTVNAGTFNVTDGVGIIARSGNTTVGANVVLNVSGNGTAGRIGDSRVVVPMGEELVLDLAAGYPGGTPSITNNSSYSVYTVNA